VSDSGAQALAGLVHQLLAKDTSGGTSAATSLAASDTTSADSAAASIAGATSLLARSAAAATASAQLVLAKSGLDSDPDSDDSTLSTTPDASGAAATSAAALAIAAGTQAPAPAAIAERTIAVPVQSSQWPEALGSQVRWLTTQNIQSAVLRLSPDNLGPVQVNISVNASHVSVTFGAAHPETRTALEQALPKLREMFSGAGLSLGEATVQQQSRQTSQNPNPGARSLLQAADTDAQPVSAIRWRSGLVDEYA
jgi:flagellar hook-length control protein FliK